MEDIFNHANFDSRDISIYILKILTVHILRLLYVCLSWKVHEYYGSCLVSCFVQPDTCLSVVLAGVAMMQIVGAPCVKAGPSTNGKHPADRLSSTVDGMVVNDVYMSPFFGGSLKLWSWGVDGGNIGFQQVDVEHTGYVNFVL